MPYGVFQRGTETPRVGIAIGDQILDLPAVLKAGLLKGPAETAAKLATGTTLNALMAAEPALHAALRRQVSQILNADNPERARIAADTLLVPMAEAQLRLPMTIGSFTDLRRRSSQCRQG